MQYREADIDEHKIICKQIRSQSIFNVCLMAPVIPVTVLCFFLSFNMMLKDNYEVPVLIASAVTIGMLAIGMSIFMILLMKGFVKRIIYINNHRYMVADCSVAGRDQQNSAKHIHCFVTVGFPDGKKQRLYVTANVYSLAETGKRALLIRYSEPENRKRKLPFEVAVTE